MRTYNSLCSGQVSGVLHTSSESKCTSLAGRLVPRDNTRALKVLNDYEGRGIRLTDERLAHTNLAFNVRDA